jgi:hypothetical protein
MDFMKLLGGLMGGGGPKGPEAPKAHVGLPATTQAIMTPKPDGHSAVGTELAKKETTEALAEDPVKTGVIQKALNIIKVTLASFGLNFGDIAKTEGYLSKQEIAESYVSKEKVAEEVAAQAAKLQAPTPSPATEMSALEDGVKAVLAGTEAPEALKVLQAAAQKAATASPTLVA